jgi:hypothetical protein
VCACACVSCVRACVRAVPHGQRSHSAPASTNWRTASPAHRGRLEVVAAALVVVIISNERTHPTHARGSRRVQCVVCSSWARSAFFSSRLMWSRLSPNEKASPSVADAERATRVSVSAPIRAGGNRGVGGKRREGTPYGGWGAWRGGSGGRAWAKRPRSPARSCSPRDAASEERTTTRRRNGQQRGCDAAAGRRVRRRRAACSSHSSAGLPLCTLPAPPPPQPRRRRHRRGLARHRRGACACGAGSQGATHGAKEWANREERPKGSPRARRP